MKKAFLLILSFVALTTVNAYAQSPGGVSANLKIWLKADDAVTTSGADVTAWVNQANAGETFTKQDNDEPTYIAVDPTANYNPSITYANDDSGVEYRSAVENEFFSDFSPIMCFYMVNTTTTNKGTACQMGHFDYPAFEVNYLGTANRFGVVLDNTNWETTGYHTTQTVSTNVNTIFTGGFNNAAGATDGRLVNYKNGAFKEEKSSTTDGRVAIANSDANYVISIGANEDGNNTGQTIDGIMPEIIIYSSYSLTDNEIQRINTYLAIKYGVPLDQSAAALDYLATNSSVIWNATTNSTYSVGIAGIGRDDTEELGQVKTKSQTPEGILIVEAEGEGTNAANAFTDIADLEYFIWGNNGGASNWTTGGPGTYSLLSRQWRVEENNGDVGTCTFAFDVDDPEFNVPSNGSTTESYFLLYDTDGDLDLSDETPVQLYDNGTNGDDVSGDNIWTINGINMADGAIFTLGANNVVAPGGISAALKVWNKADAGTSTTTNAAAITFWQNLGIGGQLDDLVAFPGHAVAPTYVAEASNYNPAVAMRKDAGLAQLNVMNGHDEANTGVSNFFKVKAMAGETVNTGYNVMGQFSDGTLSATSTNLGHRGPYVNNATSAGMYHFNVASDASNLLDPSQDNILAFLYTTGVASTYPYYVNGKTIAETSHTPPNNGNNFHLNTDTDGGDDGGPYEYQEVIVYEQQLSNADRLKVETYLAVKYGVSIDQTVATNYVDTDGNVIWNGTTNAGYGTGIAGIGRDDAEALGQVKSKSQTREGILYVQADGEGTNAANTFVDIADKEYFIWGNDGNAATYTTTNAPTNYSKVTRTWKLQETGDVGACTFAFDVADADFDVPALTGSATNYVLMYSDNVNLGAGANGIITLYDDGTNGDLVGGDNVWSASGVDLANATFFSIGYQSAFTATLGSGTSTAGVLCYGSTKQPIYEFTVAIDAGTGDRTFNGLSFTTGGTYAAADVDQFELWYNTSNNLGSATKIANDLTPTGGNGTTESFAAVSQLLNASATSYFWIVADVDATPTDGNTISVNAITTNSISLVSGAKAGAAGAGNTHTFTYPRLSSSLTPADICSATTFTYTATSGSPAPTFAWSRATVANIAPAGTTGTGNLSEALTNSSNASIDVTYAYITTSATCTSASQNVVVTVHPTPTLSSSTSPSTICSGTSFTYTPTGNVAGTTFTWARSANADISEATTTGTGGVNEVLTSTSASNVNVTYVYTSTANGCSNNENVVPVVRPNPQGSFTGNTRCAGDAGSFGQLTWTATAGTGPFVVDTTASQAGVNSGVPYSLPVSTPTVTSVYALAKVTDAFGCERTTGFTAGTATVTVTGAAISYTNGTPASATTCAGTAVTFTVTAANVNTYTWEVSTDGGGVYNPIVAAGAGPIYSNYNTSELTVSNPTVAHSGYKYRSVMIPACGPNITSDVADLTVNVLPVLSSATGAGAGGTICSAIGAVTYTPTSVTPGTTFAWTRLGQAGIIEATSTGTGNINETLTNTTTSPIVVTYNYISTALGCNDPAGEDILATINPDANLVLTSAVGTDNQTVCKGDAITDVTYTYNEGATSYTITGLPTGVTQSASTNTITITGTPSVDGVYNYTVQTIGSCNQTQAVGTITSGASLSSAPGTDNQVVCKNTAITDITYAIGSSNATVTPLPNGVSSAYINNVFTISGTPTVEGTFGYTVSTPGTCTTPTDLTGVITVGIGPVIPGTDDQTVCEGELITPILFSYAGGGVPVVTGLPTGLRDSVNASNDTLIILGAPTVTGAHNYTITSTSCATLSTIFGEITVGAGVVTPGDDDKTVCYNEPLTPTIKYAYAGGGVASAAGLPPGLLETINATNDTLTIAGTPTVSGTYDYTINVPVGTCGTTSTFIGSLTIGVGIVTPGDDDKTVCFNEPLTPTIKYAYAGGGVATADGLPPGLNGVTNPTNDTLTITGTPNVSGTYDYTVNVPAGTCGAQSSINGSLTIGTGVVTPGDDDKTVCFNEALTPTIKYAYAGGGVATATGLPPGLFESINATNDTLTIAGTPTVSGTYDYTVNVPAGTCGVPSSFIGSLTIGVGVVNPGDDNKDVCEGAAINDIKYAYAGGGTPTVVGLPPGLLPTTNVALDTLTIGGIPTQSGTFTYTITTTGGGCSNNSVITGVLTIGLASATGGSNMQTVCINTAITDIVYTLPAFVTGANATGLPAGVIGIPGLNRLTISGTPTVAGTFNYTVATSSAGCNSSNLTGTIIVNKDTITQTGTADTSPTLCANQAIDSLFYSISGTANGLSLSPLNQGLKLDFLGGGAYVVSGTPPAVHAVNNYELTSLSASCASTGTVTIPISVNVLKPEADFIMDKDKGVAPLLVNFTNNSINADSYAWTFGDPAATSTETDPTRIFEAPGSYDVQLIASANNLCHDTISYPVQPFAITLPNIFTPNNDNVNDLFRIDPDGLTEVKASIFDRWGLKVGEINGINDSWDGRSISTGLECNTGTYFVVLELTDISDNINKYSFTVELKR